jgi:predicted RNA-binding protein with PIN domain
MKHFLIDAHNVIYTSQLFKKQLDNSLDHARNSLLQMINSYSQKYPSYKFTVIFDGKIGYNSTYSSNISVVSSGNKEADELIRKKISKTNSTKNLAVVSSDHEVVSYAKINACEIITSASFINLINNSTKKKSKATKKNNHPEKPYSSSKNEIEEFKRIFGADE